MPLVVVTTAEKKSRAAEADGQASHLLRISESVFEILAPNFKTRGWELWENTPREWLGGKLLAETAESARPRDFVVPVPPPEGTRTLDTVLPEGKATVHGQNCIVLKGTFSLPPRVNVPATLEINLATAYAHGPLSNRAGAGDVVFDTQKTPDQPHEGIYDLLRARGQAGARYARSLRDLCFHLNDRIQEGPTVKWASLKALEGAVEPSSSMYFLYLKDPTTIWNFLRRKLLEVALERGENVYKETPLVPKQVYRTIVGAIVDRIAQSNAYARAVTRRAELRTLIARPGGSVMISTDNPEAPTQVAAEVLDAIQEDFRNDLARQLGASDAFEDRLDQLARRTDGESGPGGTV